MGPRRMALITTVHTATRKIEARLKDGGEVQVSLFDIPPMFVWPNVGEYWVIRQDGGYWKLDTKIDNVDHDNKIEDLNPGEAKISADIIKTPSGKSVVTVDNNHTPVTINNANVIEIGSIKIVIGTGAPEGAVTAPIGSLFLRKDESAGNTLYVKSAGASNTGWTAVG